MFWNKESKEKQAMQQENLQLAARLSYQEARLDHQLCQQFLARQDADTAAKDAFLAWQKTCYSYPEQEQWTIEEEIRALESYIQWFTSLQTEPFFFKTTYQIEDPTLLIQPLISLALVQNALRNGYNSMENHPVKIRIKVAFNQFTMEVSNRVNHYLEDQANNTLIKNFQSRLAYSYPGEQHNLLINSNSNVFKCFLQVKLVL